MLVKEILCRRLNFLMGVLAVIIAVSALTGAVELLKRHDLQTQQILAEKEKQTQEKMTVLRDEMRKATLKLSFNLVILPKEQNLRDWYMKDYSDHYMPEEYVTRLTSAGIVVVQHILPILQQKVTWPETKRSIILVGTRGEVPHDVGAAKKPLLEPVPAGTIVLGSELHRSLSLKPGDKVKMFDRDFTVHKCYEQRGSKDDITAWVHLKEAQEIFEKKGTINAIMALECLCEGVDELLPLVRSEIAKVLPDTQVIEFGSQALARFEARTKVGEEAKALLEQEKENRERMRAERERFAAVIVPVVMLGCAVWIAVLGFSNVRDRRSEIGILRAMGFRSGQVMMLFLSKSMMMAILGAAIGSLIGVFSGGRLAMAIDPGSETAASCASAGAAIFLLAVSAAVALTVTAGWIPATIAAAQDPAEILQKE
jgi:ABC-type lipoprotein release transport system permease subunit